MSTKRTETVQHVDPWAWRQAISGRLDVLEADINGAIDQAEAAVAGSEAIDLARELLAENDLLLGPRECLTCKGEGGGFVRNGPESWEWEPCSACLGTGQKAAEFGSYTHPQPPPG